MEGKVKTVQIVPLKSWMTQAIYYVGLGYLMSRAYLLLASIVHTAWGFKLPLVSVGTLIG